MTNEENKTMMSSKKHFEFLHRFIRGKIHENKNKLADLNRSVLDLQCETDRLQSAADMFNISQILSIEDLTEAERLEMLLQKAVAEIDL